VLKRLGERGLELPSPRDEAGPELRVAGRISDELEQQQTPFPARAQRPHDLPHLVSKLLLGRFAPVRRYLERLLARYRALASRPADSRITYPRLVLGHGVARVTSTLAWIDKTTATIEQRAAERAPG
jgi:hypothetical protein